MAGGFPEERIYSTTVSGQPKTDILKVFPRGGVRIHVNSIERTWAPCESRSEMLIVLQLVPRPLVARSW